MKTESELKSALAKARAAWRKAYAECDRADAKHDKACTEQERADAKCEKAYKEWTKVADKRRRRNENQTR